jgi:hypothetical protein
MALSPSPHLPIQKENPKGIRCDLDKEVIATHWDIEITVNFTAVIHVICITSHHAP